MLNSKHDISSLLEKVFDENGTLIDLNKIFEEKLKEYDLSKRRVLNLLSIDQRTLDDTLNGNAKQPSIINILKISHFLEIDDLYEMIPAVLKNQDRENIASIEKARKASFIAKNFDIKKLSSIGFFDETEDTDHLVDRLLKFFGYDSIFEFERYVTAPLYSKSKRKHSDKMKDFWIASAYQCFKKIDNPNEYDREALKDIITKIRPYSQDVTNGLFTVCKALYNVGVTVIVQTHLTLTQVRGGTFVVNDKPCIVLTDLNKRYTTIWETLIHELSHVLYDLETISREGYHLTGDSDLLLIEDSAEEFAQEFFCGRNNYERIKRHINDHFLVERFAKDLEIHPAFIYSSFRQFQQQDHQKNYYGAFQAYFPDHTQALKKLSPVSWKENSIYEAAANLKLVFELNT